MFSIVKFLADIRSGSSELPGTKKDPPVQTGRPNYCKDRFLNYASVLSRQSPGAKQQQQQLLVKNLMTKTLCLPQSFEIVLGNANDFGKNLSNSVTCRKP